MAEEKVATIQRANRELRDLHDHLVGHREHPGLITMAKTLIRLTNSPEENAKMDQAEKEAEAARPKCQHEVVNRKTKKCIACGETVED